MPYCLAIDIGASSGRHILGEYVNGKIETGSYTNQNGEKVYTTEILARDISFCGDYGNNMERNNNSYKHNNATADDFNEIDTEELLPF